MPSQAALRRFGRAVGEARDARGWSQEELAVKAGVSQSNVSGWESGKWAPDPEQVFAVERALRVKPGALSEHLGFVPAEPSVRSTDLVAAILDSDLDELDRRALAGLYRQLRRRR